MPSARCRARLVWSERAAGALRSKINSKATPVVERNLTPTTGVDVRYAPSFDVSLRGTKEVLPERRGT